MTDTQIEEAMLEMAVQKLAMEEEGKLSWARSLLWRIRLVHLALQHENPAAALRYARARDGRPHAWLVPCRVQFSATGFDPCRGCPMNVEHADDVCRSSIRVPGFAGHLLRQLTEAHHKVLDHPEMYKQPRRQAV
jgi:hypothetical protein